MAFIEGQERMELAFTTYQVNIEELEKIKNDYGIKYYLKLEPLFNYIKKNKLSTIYNNKLIESIENNVELYYNINIDYFVNIINYITSSKETNVVKKLKELQSGIINDKIPKKLTVTNVELTDNLIAIFDIRYKALLLRYITFLLYVFK